ncbi:thiamine diphosphokinase [Eubacteriales bacterium KG127]
MEVLIITGYIHNLHNLNINPVKYDYIIAADKGVQHAIELKLTPDIIIGDFDSLTSDIWRKQFNTQEIITLPCEKDMTDTEAALDLAVTNQPSSVTILGGLGGRIDHTLGNISLMNKYHFSITIFDSKNKVTLLYPGYHKIHKDNFKYLSLFPYYEDVYNLTIKAVKYPLNDTFFPKGNTLGISNEILNEYCELSFDKGTLLICQTND